MVKAQHLQNRLTSRFVANVSFFKQSISNFNNSFHMHFEQKDRIQGALAKSKRLNASSFNNLMRSCRPCWRHSWQYHWIGHCHQEKSQHLCRCSHSSAFLRLFVDLLRSSFGIFWNTPLVECICVAPIFQDSEPSLI